MDVRLHLDHITSEEGVGATGHSYVVVYTARTPLGDLKFQAIIPDESSLDAAATRMRQMIYEMATSLAREAAHRTPIP